MLRAEVDYLEREDRERKRRRKRGRIEGANERKREKEAGRGQREDYLVVCDDARPGRAPAPPSRGRGGERCELVREGWVSSVGSRCRARQSGVVEAQ